MYMNIDILKQRPVPQERQQFELLLPEKKAVKIVDKRGDVKIDRESIIQRIRNKVVVDKTEQESSPSPDKTPEPKIDDTEPETPKSPEVSRPKVDDVRESDDRPITKATKHFKKRRKKKEDNEDRVEFMDINDRLPVEKERIMHASSYYMNNRKLFGRKINELSGLYQRIEIYKIKY